MKKLLLLLAAILILLITSLEPIVNYFLDKKINEIVANNSSLTINSAHLSPYSKTLFINQLAYEDTIQRIKLEHVNIAVKFNSFWKLFIDKEVHLDSLIISEAVVSISAPHSTEDRNKTPFALNAIEVIKINALKLDIASFNYQDTAKQLKGQINHIVLLAQDIEYSSSSKLTFENFDGIIDSIQIAKSNQTQIKITRLEINKEQIVLLETSIKHKATKPIQQTAIDANIDSISMHYHIDSLFRNSYLKASTVYLERFKMQAYMDKRKPPKPGRKPLIAEIIHSIKKPFCIDSLVLNNGNIHYKEQVKDSPKAGKVFFTNFKATISNITNDQNRLASNKYLHIKTNCTLMDKAPLSASIKIDLSGANQYQHISGKLASMELSVLNPTFMPLAFIKFESGKLDKLEFDYYLNAFEAEGRAQFYYHNLKVIIQNRKIFEKPKALSKIETFLANTFLFRTHNPRNGHFKEGMISFKRDTSKSVFNYWWKSLFSGMTYTIQKNPVQ